MPSSSNLSLKFFEELGWERERERGAFAEVSGDL